MKKGIVFSILFLIIDIVVYGSYKLFQSILAGNEQMFRNNVRYAFLFLIGIISAVLFISIIYTLYQLMGELNSRGNNAKLKKLVCMVGMVGTTFLSIAGAVLFVILLARSHQPEYVVKKYDQKMIAKVSTAKEVGVYYYEYENSFICSSKMVGWEYYGAGSYNPFEPGATKEPETFKFINSKGEVIAEKK